MLNLSANNKYNLELNIHNYVIDILLVNKQGRLVYALPLLVREGLSIFPETYASQCIDCIELDERKHILKYPKIILDHKVELVRRRSRRPVIHASDIRDD